MLVMKKVSALYHAVHRMMQYTDCAKASLLSKCQFQGTYINIISFKLIRKVQPLHDSFSQNSQHRELGWRSQYSN